MRWMNMKEKKTETDLLSKTTTRAFSKAGLITIGAVVFIIVLGSGGSYVWAKQYEDKLAPNTFIAGIDVGGMDVETARQHVQTVADRIVSDGVPISFEGTVKTLPLTAIVSDNVIDRVYIDVEGAIERAAQASHVEHPISDIIHLIKNLVNRIEIYPEVELVEKDKIESTVRELFPNVETLSINAGFKIDEEILITDAVNGNEFDFETFHQDLLTSLISLKEDPDPINLRLVNVQAPVQNTDAEQLRNQAQSALDEAPYTLTYNAPGRQYQWTITKDLLVPALAVSPTDDGQFMLTLEGEAFDAFLEEIAKDVEVKPRNAKFEIKDGKVTEFVGSRPGVELNKEGTIRAIEELLNSEAESVEIVTNESAPEIATGDVNDLGISELLGVGISDYSNSPPNRIANIRNAVKLLNGILIAPGETFSLVEALQPFTYDNGFLPELVIKGDKIEPEMGGGACQIGTTTFRATMNAGLPIVERRNHSLVVDHYNDPTNGNPGTDATIYEVNGKGAPDYKFLNDTGNYILFQAEMLEDIEELRFSFWGTSDGRKGSYTPPVVTRWIGPGPQQEIETTDLEPGQRKCQNAFTGADAHFTYTVEKPDGTVEEQIFESHYRALPSICLVGVDENAEDTEETGKEGGKEGIGDDLDSTTNNESSLENNPADDISESESDTMAQENESQNASS